MNSGVEVYRRQGLKENWGNERQNSRVCEIDIFCLFLHKIVAEIRQNLHLTRSKRRDFLTKWGGSASITLNLYLIYPLVDSGAKICKQEGEIGGESGRTLCANPPENKTCRRDSPRHIPSLQTFSHCAKFLGLSQFNEQIQ